MRGEAQWQSESQARSQLPQEGAFAIERDPRGELATLRVR